jgi:Fe-S-cluster containining protein
MTRLYQIDERVRHRSEALAAARGAWPCRNGCDDCCRSLAAEPGVTEPEWRRIAEALNPLPSEIHARIVSTARQDRPVTCPLLDRKTGSCLVYEARPVACRAYGFYLERDHVLGCGRIASIAEQNPPLIWGNHSALREDLQQFGIVRTLSEWAALTLPDSPAATGSAQPGPA